MNIIAQASYGLKPTIVAFMRCVCISKCLVPMLSLEQTGAVKQRRKRFMNIYIYEKNYSG